MLVRGSSAEKKAEKKDEQNWTDQNRKCWRQTREHIIHCWKIINVLCSAEVVDENKFQIGNELVGLGHAAVLFHLREEKEEVEKKNEE